MCSARRCWSGQRGNAIPICRLFLLFVVVFCSEVRGLGTSTARERRDPAKSLEMTTQLARILVPHGSGNFLHGERRLGQKTARSGHAPTMDVSEKPISGVSFE